MGGGGVEGGKIRQPNGAKPNVIYSIGCHSAADTKYVIYGIGWHNPVDTNSPSYPICSAYIYCPHTTVPTNQHISDGYCSNSEQLFWSRLFSFFEVFFDFL
jgi:hypothetical protein